MTPYAYAEAFYSLDQQQWTRARFAPGVEWTITKQVVLEVYFARQNELGSAQPTIHAAGLALQIYLR